MNTNKTDSLENEHKLHHEEHEHHDHHHEEHEHHDHHHEDHAHHDHHHEEHAHHDHHHEEHAHHDHHHEEHAHHDHHHEEHTHHDHQHDDHCCCHHHEEHEHHHDHDGHEHCCDHDHDHHDEHCHSEKCCCHDHGEAEERNKHVEDILCDRTVEFTLDGLDCPHCASQIENELEKKPGVAYAQVNLITGKLTVGLDKDYEGDIRRETVRAVKKFEPDVEVTANGETAKASFARSLRSENATIIRLSAGAALFAVGLILSHFASASVYIYLPILITAYIILGFDVVFDAVRNILKGRIFDEKFLMTVSTIGAFVIGEYPEAAAVMLFYQIGELFQRLAVRRSRRSIAELMDVRPDSANVLREGGLLKVSPEEVEIDETIVIKPGEKVPLDGIVTEGETTLDTCALTGESTPRKASVGDTVLSGCINESGVISVRVTKSAGESTASKILELVENASSQKAPSENFISVFARYYTPVVVIFALLLAVVPPLLFDGQWAEWIRRCFVFLVISCPCALVISIPLTFFGGIGAASRSGVLVKGSNYLEALSAADTFVFDKTGTLTKGEFAVSKTIPEKGVSERELLRYAAAAEKMSNHPIARSVMQAYSGEEPKVSGYREISGHGVCARSDGKEIIAGNSRLMKDNGINADARENGTVVYVAADKKYLGCLVISDRVKNGSREAIERLHKLGVSKTVMLTGDNENAAKAVAWELGIDDYHAGLLPNDKVALVEELLENKEDSKRRLAFVGDGINDAPVLARADVGIAMGALGSDAAIEAADVVLMNDDPLSICEAIGIARRTKRIVTQNITLVLAVKAVILILGALGIAGMWAAVFGDVGVMIIAVLNAVRLIAKRR